ncbi:MAG: cytochrome C oxidase subunit IV family protein [Pseudomonadales bacterium]|nr:cytochrome C oxidase subunit IV family protein [Pseudomonadales bacterium]
MITILKDKLNLVLVALLTITLVSWWLMTSNIWEVKTAGALVLLFAFVKVHLIVSHFMESTQAQLSIRYLFDLWVIAVGGMIIAMYFWL